MWDVEICAVLLRKPAAELNWRWEKCTITALKTNDKNIKNTDFMSWKNTISFISFACCKCTMCLPAQHTGSTYIFWIFMLKHHLWESDEYSVLMCSTVASLLFGALWECNRPVNRTAAFHLNCSNRRITHLLLQDRAGKHDSNRHSHAHHPMPGSEQICQAFVEQQGVRRW